LPSYAHFYTDFSVYLPYIQQLILTNPKPLVYLSAYPNHGNQPFTRCPQRWRDHWRQNPAVANDDELARLLRRYFDPALIFCAGQYFFFVIEGGPEVKIRYIEGNFEQVTGRAKEQFIGQSLLKLHRLTIPAEDSPVLMAISQFCHDFLGNTAPDKRNQVKFSFYFNILHPSGRLVPVIQQDSVYINAEGIPEYNFSFVTDISHLKAKNELMFSILAIDEQGNQQFKCFSPNLLDLHAEERGLLTVRERQIISGLAEGLSSKQIAADLGIAFHTVNTHRRNMLTKTGCKSSAQLVKYALKHTLI
jgi:DNA-binding CsgD family transcriptional regulator